LVERAKDSLGRSAEHFCNHAFIHEWSELLNLPLSVIRHRLICRGEEMTRLRLSTVGSSIQPVSAAAIIRG
jgi:hypothetical protein